MATPELAPAPTGATPTPPPLDALAGRFGGGAVRLKELRALHRWLTSLSLTAPLGECAQAIEAGVRWLKPGPAKTAEGEPCATARLRVLLDAIELSPVWRRTVAQTIATV